jgi:hypothetical protein
MPLHRSKVWQYKKEETMYLSPRSFINQPAQALAEHGIQRGYQPLYHLDIVNRCPVAASRTGMSAGSAPNAPIAKPPCRWQWSPASRCNRASPNISARRRWWPEQIGDYSALR